MKYRISVTDNFMQGYAQHDAKAMKRIDRLIADIAEHPTHGIGKPEPLRFDLSGCWSRRINGKDRIVYRIEDDAIILMDCRGHYGH